MSALDREGHSPEQVLNELTERGAADSDWRDGRTLTGLYDPGADAYALSVEAYSRFLMPNALYINLYPSLSELEREVVSSVASVLGGGAETVGNMTSGGTESIMMAVKTSRDHAREHRSEVTRPEMVLPVTAHPAFLKAAHYLGLHPVVTPVDGSGYRADVAAFREAIGNNTILAVASAPNFSHGTIDPVEEMAAAARERGVLFHVDACVGGLYLPFLRAAGVAVRPFDFSVEGVTSMSADLHKYGYAPKNASVVLYRDRALRRHAYFVCSSTTEYAVINPTAQSSRTGGPVAAAWAMFRHLGHEGYERAALATHESAQRMLEGIEAIDGVEVLGDPEMCMFTLGSETINVFELDDEMRGRGWRLLPQFACGGSPANLHVSVGVSNVEHTEAFLEDLAGAVAALKERGPSVDRELIGREVAELATKPLDELFVALAPMAGLTGEGLPESMAPLNTVLDFLPADVRDRLLTEYVNALY